MWTNKCDIIVASGGEGGGEECLPRSLVAEASRKEITTRGSKRYIYLLDSIPIWVIV